MEARPKFFYPSIVVAATAVTLFSLIGIASLTGMLPLARSGEQDTPAAMETAPPPSSAPAPRRAQATAPAAAPKPARPAPAPHPAETARAICADCGRVEAIKTVEQKGEGSGLGAVAGGVAGALIGNQFGRGNGRTAMTIAGGAGGAYLGNQIEQNTRRTTTYQIMVRMEDGTLRTFQQNEAPAVAVGQPVRIVDQAVMPAP